MIGRMLTLSLPFALCLAASGCGVDQAPTDEVGSASQPYSSPKSGYIYIFVTDNRTLSNVTVTFEGTNEATGSEYSDWEAVSGDLPGTDSANKMESDLRIYDRTSGDALDEIAYGPWSAVGGTSQILLYPAYFSPHFVNGRVTVNATINGYCHEDYEDFTVWDNNMLLQFNGWGASWDGSCYRGDMLKPYQ